MAPARRSQPSGGYLPRKGSLSSLADPATRRWVVLGTLGIMASLLLTAAVALLSNRSVASADVPAAEVTRANRVTMVREIGGAPRSSPTPGTGVTASAPAAPGSATADPAAVAAADTGASQGIATSALRQLRKVGRAIVTAEGIRRLALGGAVPFTDGGTVTASAPTADDRQVALADTDPGVTLGNLAERGADAFLKRVSELGQVGAMAVASPGAVATSTPAIRTDQVPTATPVPATATSVPATATAVPATATSAPATATSVPATATSAPATSVPATATAVPATATPVVVIVYTATPLPSTPTPIVVTATPEPTRRPTRTPTPEVVVVTATPSSAQSLFPNGMLPNMVAGAVPWLQQIAPTNTPQPAVVMGPPPTAAPTNTPIPTATQYVVQDPRSAPVTAVPAAPTSTPHRAEGIPTLEPIPAGPAPILAETGTRTPLNPTPQATPRQDAAPDRQQSQPGQPGQPNQAAGAQGQQPEGQREPSALEQLTARALVAVNAARAQAGALPLARNGALDTASALHARYDVATGQAEGNFQTRGNPLFLGETPGARVARAATSTRQLSIERIAEVMALGETEPERAVQGWLDSVYHRVLILDLAAQFVGYGQQTQGTATTAVMDLGGKRDVANASGWFPASGATEVPTRCTCDDYAEATGKPGPYGYPVTLLLGQIRPQGLPTLARLSENDENGPGVVAEVIDAYGNPTLLPQQPLKPNTRYVVKLAWTNGPTVSWAFTTGSQ